MFGKRNKNEVIILGSLVEGLPMEENTDLFLRLNEKELYGFGLVDGQKQEFTLDIQKMTSIVHKSEIEMQQYVKQSVPGMVIGHATFGLLGAMVGGRVQTKEKKKKTDFILINYVSDEPKSIVLITNDPNKLKFVQFFDSMKQDQATKISL